MLIFSLWRVAPLPRAENRGIVSTQERLSSGAWRLRKPYKRETYGLFFLSRYVPARAEVYIDNNIDENAAPGEMWGADAGGPDQEFLYEEKSH